MHVCEMSRYGVNIMGGHKIVGLGLSCSSHPASLLVNEIKFPLLSHFL